MRKTSVVLLLAVFPLVISNCSTSSGLCKPNNTWSVTYSEKSPGIQEIIASVPPDATAICMIRFPQMYKCAAPMFWQLDGEEVGPIATHTHLVVNAKPGEHEVTSTGRSLWDTSVQSVPGRLRVETFPGRAYFVSGVFAEGSVALKLLSEEEADDLIMESRQILSQQEISK